MYMVTAMNLFPRITTVSIFAILTAFCFWVQLNADENIKPLAFYNVVFSTNELKIDGILSEKEWDTAPEYSNYYEYWKANPAPARQKTSLKMLYSKSGIYIGITNHDPDMKKIKNDCTMRDSEDLWRDDCNEIFIAPYLNPVGYTKFSVTSAGIPGDMKKIDAAVSLNDWNGNSWQAAVSKNSDSWILEVFIPWEDIGAKASNGSIWRFCNTRFSYTSGKFEGATFSPGGNYNNISGFGYIYFSADKALNINTVAAMLSERIPYPWILEFNEKLISCTGRKQFKIDNIDDLIAAKQSEIRKLLLDAGRKPPEIKTGTTAKIQQLEALYKQKNLLYNEYWHSKITALIDLNTKN